MVNRNLFAWLLIFIVTGCFNATFAQKNKRSAKPNIILILADDFGYGDLGSYGQKFFNTPNLDQLARDGIRFTQFYASSPVCAPSRASLMTGKHQGHAYIRGNNSRNNQRVPLRTEDVTVGKVLKSAGYRTGIIGKWGLGEPGTTGTPGRQGFDYFFGYLNQTLAHNYYPDYLWRNEEKVNLAGKTYSHDLFTREALDFVRRESENPFFLYLAYTIPHANNELTRKTGNGMEVPTDAPYTGEKWTPQQKNYAAMIARMDADVGKISNLLKELALDENTVIIFTGDNGPQGKEEGGYEQSFFNSSGGLRGVKRSLYEGGVREPMIVRWKGGIRGGQTSPHVWAQYDLLPTFAALAGAKIPGGIDGVSMLPVLRGGRKPNHEHLYWEFYEGGFVQAVRRGKWKALRRGLKGQVELYDLQSDVRETRNLASKYPHIVAQMADVMNREHTESEHWTPDENQ